jgi:hypothetical protein
MHAAPARKTVLTFVVLLVLSRKPLQRFLKKYLVSRQRFLMKVTSLDVPADLACASVVSNTYREYIGHENPLKHKNQLCRYNLIFEFICIYIHTCVCVICVSVLIV